MYRHVYTFYKRTIPGKITRLNKFSRKMFTPQNIIIYLRKQNRPETSERRL